MLGGAFGLVVSSLSMAGENRRREGFEAGRSGKLLMGGEILMAMGCNWPLVPATQFWRRA